MRFYPVLEVQLTLHLHAQIIRRPTTWRCVVSCSVPWSHWLTVRTIYCEKNSPWV